MLAQLTDTDVVYIYRTDRLGRSTSDLLTIVEKIKGAGARLVSITDGIDTGTGMVADMFLTLLSVVAQYERSLISDRTKSSLRVLKERGVELGRPRKMTPVIIRQVQTMHDDPQVSVKDVCASLGISRSSYYQALRHVDQEKPMSATCAGNEKPHIDGDRRHGELNKSGCASA